MIVKFQSGMHEIPTEIDPTNPVEKETDPDHSK